MLRIGEPMAGGVSSDPMPSGSSVAVEMTVASVGPYVFQTRAAARQRAARSEVRRSAPSTQFSTPGTLAGSRTPRRDGTTLATWTPVSRIIRVSAAGSVRSSVVAMARVPPPPRVTATSSTAASKLNEANWSATVPGSTPSTGRIASARLATPPWATVTPLGRPVEPEV
ncbi:hypothetical protein SFUMM280S_06075 [Streptomyces fumanus]